MRSVALVVGPQFQVMSMAALTAFEFVNLVADQPVYDLHLVSETGGPVRTSFGVTIDSLPFDCRIHDTVIVAGGLEVVPAAAGTIGYLQSIARHSRRLAAICNGAFILAEAGLLDGRRATTHWATARLLRERFPAIKVEEDRIFIVDGSIWTSAGMTAGLDLALGMVENDLGPEMARTVAQHLVLHHRRAGGQSQHSALLEIDAKSDRIQTALGYARRHLRSELSVEELAGVANLSPRQFSRVFRAETGQSPAKAVEHLRIEAARVMMEQTRHPIETVAAETGFADRERMRRAFIRTFGQPPQVIRRNAQFAEIDGKAEHV